MTSSDEGGNKRIGEDGAGRMKGGGALLIGRGGGGGEGKEEVEQQEEAGWGTGRQERCRPRSSRWTLGEARARRRRL